MFRLNISLIVEHILLTSVSWKQFQLIWEIKQIKLKSLSIQIKQFYSNSNTFITNQIHIVLLNNWSSLLAISA